MITTKLQKDRSYIINYDIHLTSEKQEDELQPLSDFNNTNDYLLMRIVFSSDNFKYTKAALPYKTYYYSSINSEQISDSSKKNNKIYHIHRLTRKNLLDNFFYIELGSCGNEFSYSLRDYNKFNEVMDQDFYVNKTNLKHEYKYHYGKKVIEVELNDATRDLLLIVFPLKTSSKYVCQDISKNIVCEDSLYSDYVVRYRTSKSRIDLEKYKIDREGILNLHFFNSLKFEF